MKFIIPASIILFSITVSARAPLTTDKGWLYQGCYSAPAGHMLDLFIPQNLTGTSIASCFSACGNSTSRYAALGDGECYCANALIASLKPNPDESNCTVTCGPKGADACGGSTMPDTKEPASLSLYDSTPPVPVSFSGWNYKGCIAHTSEIQKFIHTATLGDLSVERCLIACDTSPTDYTFAGLSGQACYCGSKKLLGDNDPKFVDTEYTTCNFPCPGNPAQACGGTFNLFDPAISFYERDGGPSDATSIDPSQTGQLMTRTIITADPTKTGKSSTSGASGSEQTKKSEAGAVKVGSEVLAGILGLIAVL